MRVIENSAASRSMAELRPVPEVHPVMAIVFPSSDGKFFSKSPNHLGWGFVESVLDILVLPSFSFLDKVVG